MAGWSCVALPWVLLVSVDLRGVEQKVPKEVLAMSHEAGARDDDTAGVSLQNSEVTTLFACE